MRTGLPRAFVMEHLAEAGSGFGIRTLTEASCPNVDSIADLPPFENEPVKPRKPRKRTEWALQVSAVKQLRAIVPADYVVTSWCAERASMREGSLSRMQGQTKGWPDTGVFGDGRCWLIEWKAPGGSLSVAQKETHARLRTAGIPLATCYDVDDAIAFLRACGCRFRGRIAA